jgi:VIT1/CCC1 family predicted Fe2+/Mn2+ transporter
MARSSTSSPSAAACIARIIDAAGGAVTEDELADLQAKIERRARMRAKDMPTESTETRVLAVSREMAEEERIKAFIEKRSAAINVLRRKKIASFIEAAPVNKAEALNALNVGALKGFDGSFLSVQAKALALEMDLWGGMMADMRRAGLIDPLRARTPEFDREIADALEDVDGDPATVTKQHGPLAMKVAKVIRQASGECAAAAERCRRLRPQAAGLDRAAVP